MTRRLVATGGKVAQHATLTIRIDNRFWNNKQVIDAGLPVWFPKQSPTGLVKDWDEIRKQRIEEGLANG